MGWIAIVELSSKNKNFAQEHAAVLNSLNFVNGVRLFWDYTPKVVCGEKCKVCGEKPAGMGNYCSNCGEGL